MSTPPTPARVERTRARMREALAGRGGRLSFLLFLGPAVIASIAYMDPGNDATNIQAGAGYGFSLLWVVLLANLTAMLFQALSARLGIATGLSLAELSRALLPRPLVLGMWLVAELAAMATDLAEFLGAAVGLALLMGWPLMAGMLATALITTALLTLERRGFRSMERAIAGFVAVIGLCYLAEVLLAPIDWAAAGRGLVTPRIADTGALTVAVGIIGATVMPHAIFLHSGLAAERLPGATPAERRRLARLSDIEVVAALALAGAVNLAMVMTAAAAFHGGHAEVAEIETAYHALTPLLGGLAATVFLVSLLASGISSSAVGTLAGQAIMGGFLRRRTPLWLRRAVTMLPAFAVVAAGVDTTRALVLSQVVLSLALPVPMLALLGFVGRRRLMGPLRPPGAVLALAGLAAAGVLGLNALLLVRALGGG